MSITYVITTRNDHHCGNPMERLRLSLKHNLHIHLDAKFIIVDWGSEESVSDLICDWISMYDRVRVIYVPPEITSSYPTPFYETLALNIGIRRADTRFIARLDQDIMIGLDFVHWFQANLEDYEYTAAYFSLRRELYQGEKEPHDHAPTWSSWLTTCDFFYRGAVGILLATRSAWHYVHGYDEGLMYRNHMEHDLCLRFRESCGLMNLSPLVNAAFYHLWHEPIKGQPGNVLRDVPDLEKEARNHTARNHSNWGLGNQLFSEITI